MTAPRLVRLAAAALVALALAQLGRTESLEERERRALAALGPAYVPHTRHRLPDGRPRYTNRLILEASPYLLQHAHNPVDWYPWGEEAFARARREHKPILLSIGYSTCHWCHVMEEESFEDEETAAYLNAHYVAIKVDREARPDLDAVYMTAVQALGVSGGWPLTVWLTEDGQPFYGGTYFPARASARDPQGAFLPVLKRVQAIYASAPERVRSAAADLTARVRAVMAPPAGAAAPSAAPLRVAAALARRDFDAEHGGFGTAPKFPQPPLLDLLLRLARREDDAAMRGMVEQTLDAMARGGIRDQLGGGFHRYATDAAWRVPHFEKMLYDNAQLASVYLAAAQATGRAELAAVAGDTLDYLASEMTDPSGAFWAASDADSPGGEGAFFTWTPEEIMAALPPEAARLALAYFAVGREGPVDGRSVLSTPRPLPQVATGLGLAPDAAAATLAEAGARLYAVRAHREPPAVDRKVIASWNGLAISAFAQAALVLDDSARLSVATRAADAVFALLGEPPALAHHAFRGRAAGEAFLDDYAMLAAACLDLFEAGGDPRWLERALALQAVLDERFWDDHGGGYFATSTAHEPLLAREKPLEDGALPSGNGVAVRTLLRLAALTGDERFRERAERTLAAAAPLMARYPLAMPGLLAALEASLDRPKEIVVAAERPKDAAPLLARLRAIYLPNRVVALLAGDGAAARLAPLVPLVADKTPRAGRATAYVCEHGVCDLPTTDPDVFARTLAEVAPLP